MGKSRWGKGSPGQSLGWRSVRQGAGYASHEDPGTGRDEGCREKLVASITVSPGLRTNMPAL